MAQVLVVEDHDDIREMMAELLRMEGFDVLEAEHGRRALDLLTGSDGALPAVVLLDIAMPVMSGLELLDALDERGMLPALPVVVVSASALPSAARGARAFLQKPLDFALMLETVRTFCSAQPAEGAGQLLAAE